MCYEGLIGGVHLRSFYVYLVYPVQVGRPCIVLCVVKCPERYRGRCPGGRSDRFCYLIRHRSVRILRIRRDLKGKAVAGFKLASPQRLFKLNVLFCRHGILDGALVGRVIRTPDRRSRQSVPCRVVCHRHRRRQDLIRFFGAAALYACFLHMVHIALGVGSRLAVARLISGILCGIFDRSVSNQHFIFIDVVLTVNDRSGLGRHLRVRICFIRCQGKGELIPILHRTSPHCFSEVQVRRCDGIIVDRTSRAAPGIVGCQFVVRRVIFHRHSRFQFRRRYGCFVRCRLLYCVGVGFFVNLCKIRVSFIKPCIFYRVLDFVKSNGCFPLPCAAGSTHKIFYVSLSGRLGCV